MDFKCQCGSNTALTHQQQVCDTPIRYLKEYKCNKCGYFICDHFNNFLMMGRLKDNQKQLSFSHEFWI